MFSHRKGGDARVRRKTRRPRLMTEPLEPRLQLSTGALGPGGVDALALGDVNGDRVVDLVVAGRQAGHYVVTIYDGVGTQDKSSSTGSKVLTLATLTDPLGQGVGPLSIAVGDFNGDGVSELAIAAAAGGGAQIATYKFQLPAGASPIDHTVTPVPLATAFVPSGFNSARGLSLAAADMDGNGADELIVGAVGPKFSKLDQLSFSTAGGWQLEKSISLPKGMSGVDLSAGDLTGDGVPDIAAINQSNGKVAVFNGSTLKWSSTMNPLGQTSAGARVAIVASEDAPGALVVTPGAKSPQLSPVLVSRANNKTYKFRILAPIKGSGALVPLGGGWVYQPSTIIQSGSFPYSKGPTAPTVLFGSTTSNSVVVQGFTATLSPSKADTNLEPVLASATAGTAFIPLQKPDTFTISGGASAGAPAPLVAFPPIVYHSPYSVDLSSAPASIYQGLLSTSAVTSGSGTWGPHADANTPPVIPQTLSTPTDVEQWLRQRLMAAYSDFIGVAYQHHHDPRWNPAQGSPWNAVTLGYQSQGIDCTNLTAFAYNDALGIVMTGDTANQAAITSSAGLTIPTSLAPYIQVQVLPQYTSYQALVSNLEPGDIIYIDGSPGKPTHAITWLGSFGVDANNAGVDLIVDSTVDNPPHIDSNNHAIVGGVQIRPFADPTAGVTLNTWYFNHIDHVLRIIAD